MDNLQLWNAVKQPPKTALKTIKGGRLNGKTDISPQWRYQAMTEQFGPCGMGWKYEIVRLWTEPAPDGQVFAFAQVNVFTGTAAAAAPWSDPIPGIGGSMLVEKEKAGLHASDEGFKMAVTDALSVALKMLGVAADIYMGLWDGSKYINQPASTPAPAPPPETPMQKLTRIATANGCVGDEFREMGIWFRAGDRMTQKEMADLIDGFPHHLENFRCVNDPRL